MAILFYFSFSISCNVIWFNEKILASTEIVYSELL